MVIDLKSRGIGILITDHNVRETLSITDRSYILSEGEILASGAKTEAMLVAEVDPAVVAEARRVFPVLADRRTNGGQP